MAECGSEGKPAEEAGQNIFDIMQKDGCGGTASKQEVSEKEGGGASLMSAVSSSPGPYQPGEKPQQGNSHVEVKNDHKSTTLSTPPATKTLKLSPISMPSDPRPDPCVSPEIPGKRRRVQHDYRRLSSSGYVDDYVGRERRFSSTSESDVSLDNSTPPKVKPLKIRVPQPTDQVVNGVQSGGSGKGDKMKKESGKSSGHSSSKEKHRHKHHHREHHSSRSDTAGSKDNAVLERKSKEERKREKELHKLKILSRQEEKVLMKAPATCERLVTEEGELKSDAAACEDLSRSDKLSNTVTEWKAKRPKELHNHNKHKEKDDQPLKAADADKLGGLSTGETRQAEDLFHDLAAKKEEILAEQKQGDDESMNKIQEVQQHSSVEHFPHMVKDNPEKPVVDEVDETVLEKENPVDCVNQLTGSLTSAALEQGVTDKSGLETPAGSVQEKAATSPTKDVIEMDTGQLTSNPPPDISIQDKQMAASQINPGACEKNTAVTKDTSPILLTSGKTEVNAPDLQKLHPSEMSQVRQGGSNDNENQQFELPIINPTPDSLSGEGKSSQKASEIPGNKSESSTPVVTEGVLSVANPCISQVAPAAGQVSGDRVVQNVLPPAHTKKEGSSERKIEDKKSSREKDRKHEREHKDRNYDKQRDHSSSTSSSHKHGDRSSSSHRSHSKEKHGSSSGSKERSEGSSSSSRKKKKVPTATLR